MDIVITIVLMAAVFGLCFLVDKGFAAIFRNRSQHRSGKAVRLNKRYATFGLILSLLGALAIITGAARGLGLLICGIVVLIMGLCLLAYYLSMGIFYDEDTFLYSTFGKKSVTYRYSQIREQRLYVITGGSMLVELHMEDGKSVSIQTAMDGSLDFLNHAFSAWCRQKGVEEKDCTYHDPAAFTWFPGGEDA